MMSKPGALALLISLAAASVFPAHACQCSNLPADVLFQKATHVFVGKLVGTTLAAASASASGPAREVVHGRYELMEVFKGRPDPSGVVIDEVPGSGNCALGLVTGHHYVFHVGTYGQISRCDGSRPYDPGAPNAAGKLQSYRRLAQGLR